MKALKALKNALTVAPKGYEPPTKPGKPLAGKKVYTKAQADAAMKKAQAQIKAMKNKPVGTLVKQPGRVNLSKLSPGANPAFRGALDAMKGKPTKGKPVEKKPVLAKPSLPAPVRPGFKPPKAVAPTPDVMPPKGGPKRVQPGFKPPVGAAGFAGLAAMKNLVKPPVKKMAKGGGVERKGKTKGKFI